MLKALPIAFVVSLAAAIAASTEGGAADNSILTELGYLVNGADYTSPSNVSVRPEMSAARGGNDSGRPLGCYFCSPPLIFNSRYPKSSAETIANWTYDLHVFVQKRQGYTGDMHRSGYDVDSIPAYAEVRQFAMSWWAKDEGFSALPRPTRQAFVYDAIVDGTNVWSRYELLSGVAGGASGVIYYDVMRSKYRNASASEIFTIN